MTAQIVSESNYAHTVQAHTSESIMFDGDHGMRFRLIASVKRPLLWPRIAEGKRRDG